MRDAPVAPDVRAPTGPLAIDWNIPRLWAWEDWGIYEEGTARTIQAEEADHGRRHERGVARSREYQHTHADPRGDGAPGHPGYWPGGPAGRSPEQGPGTVRHRDRHQ